MFDRLRRILLPNSSHRAEEFWIWFAANQQHYRDVNNDGPDEAAHRLETFVKQLDRYEPYLGMAIGTLRPDAAQELVISAEGNAKLFDAVDTLVAASPELERWDVVALRPANLSVTQFNMEGKEFPRSAFAFAQVAVPDQPDALVINLYHADYTPEQRDLYLKAAALHLDTILGERAATLQLDSVDVAALDKTVPPEVLRPLDALPDVVARSRVLPKG